MGHVPRTRRTLLLHLTLALTLPGFGALAWWQVDRALSGNTLSWVYAFEWPFFALYAVYLWWRLIHEDPAAPITARSDPVATAGQDAQESSSRKSNGMATVIPSDRVAADTDDQALAEYNRYLAALAASGRRKRW